MDREFGMERGYLRASRTKTHVQRRNAIPGASLRNCLELQRVFGADKDVTYELQPLRADEEALWDHLISPYESRQLFHTRAWLDYLAVSRSVDIRLWVIR